MRHPATGNRTYSLQAIDTVLYYTADVISATDYYPFGSPMPGRNLEGERYRFGFNGQEKDNEIYGTGNSYTAEYWQYDARLGRRWNVDPVDKPWMSSYHSFSNRPITNIDPNGDNDDEWEVSSEGKVKWIEDNKEKDIFYSIDKKGNRINFVDFEYGTVENLSSGKEYDIKNDVINYQVLRIRGDDQGKELFEFLATPENFNLKAGQNVEWCRILVGEKGEKGLNFLTTSWETKREAGSYYLFENQLRFGYTIRGADHNHPNNDPTPSGTGGESGDIPVMKKWKNEGNFTANAEFRIYTSGLIEKYHPFNEKSTYQLEEFNFKAKK